MGGGVAIYIRSCIPYIIRTDLNTDNAEAVCLEIRKPKVKPLLVSTWYRPQGRSYGGVWKGGGVTPPTEIL